MRRYTYVLFLRECAPSSASDGSASAGNEWEEHPATHPPYPCPHVMPGRVYCAAVALVTGWGYRSPRSQAIRIQVPPGVYRSPLSRAIRIQVPPCVYRSPRSQAIRIQVPPGVYRAPLSQAIRIQVPPCVYRTSSVKPSAYRSPNVGASHPHTVPPGGCIQGRLTINNRYTHRQFKLKFSALLNDYDLKYAENCKK